VKPPHPFTAVLGLFHPVLPQHLLPAPLQALGTQVLSRHFQSPSTLKYATPTAFWQRAGRASAAATKAMQTPAARAALPPKARAIRFALRRGCGIVRAVQKIHQTLFIRATPASMAWGLPDAGIFKCS